MYFDINDMLFVIVLMMMMRFIATVNCVSCKDWTTGFAVVRGRRVYKPLNLLAFSVLNFSMSAD
jgi:hypothetical protein